MKSSVGRYTTVAIALHWIMAALIIANLAGGLAVGSFLESADPAMRQAGLAIVALHKSIGLTVLLLSFARLGWRLANPPPPLPSFMTSGERLSSRAMHWGFYVLMLAMPLSGWTMVSTGRTVVPLAWFGLIPVSLLPLPRALHGAAHESHELLGYLAIAMLLLHVGAVFKHRYMDRDDLLSRMWRRPGDTR